MFKTIVSILVISTFFIHDAALAKGETPRTNAPLIDSQEILYPGQELRTRIVNGIEDHRVSDELAKRGIEKAEVKQRLAAMSDKELEQIQKGAHRQAGGEVVVISVGVILLVLLLVLLLTPAHHDGGSVTVVK